VLALFWFGVQCYTYFVCAIGEKGEGRLLYATTSIAAVIDFLPVLVRYGRWATVIPVLQMSGLSHVIVTKRYQLFSQHLHLPYIIYNLYISNFHVVFRSAK
jgi:hypothetical protein